MVKKARDTAVTPAQPVSWPDLKSCNKSLELESLPGPGLYRALNVFPASLCDRFKRIFDGADKSSLALTPSPPAKRGEAKRTNDRFQIDDPRFAALLWSQTALGALASKLPSSKPGVKKAVGLNSNIRVYRYRQGTFFGPHYDDDVTDPVSKQKSEYTLLLYLSGIQDGLEGGATSFYLPLSKDKVAVEPERGMALLHKHGPDCLLHEGEPVKRGEKWILRTDVMFA